MPQVTRLTMVAEDGEAALSGAHSKIAGLSQQLMGSGDQLKSAQASVVNTAQPSATWLA